MSFVCRDVHSGVVLDMIEGDVRVGSVHFDRFSSKELNLFSRRGPFERQVASLLQTLDLPLAYVYMLAIEPTHRGSHRGLQLLTQCRDEARRRWPDILVYALCEPFLVAYWEQMGAVFTGDKVRDYHLFSLGQAPGN